MKQQFTDEALLDSALEIVIENGYNAVTMRSVAEKVGCSVQPLYSQFHDKQELMEKLYAHGLKWVENYNHEHADAGPNVFSSSGIAHIRIAQNVPNLFEFLYMSPYFKVKTMNDLFTLAEQPNVQQTMAAMWGIDERTVHDLYLDMIIFTHGLAVLIVSGAQFSDDELAERMNSAFYAFAGKAGIPLKGTSR